MLAYSLFHFLHFHINLLDVTSELISIHVRFSVSLLIAVLSRSIFSNLLQSGLELQLRQSLPFTSHLINL